MADISEANSREGKHRKRKRHGRERDSQTSKRQRPAEPLQEHGDAMASGRKEPQTKAMIGSKQTPVLPPVPAHALAQMQERGTRLPAVEPSQPLEGETASAGWRFSKPLGGRMADIDPILTNDEKHLILAYATSLQVYSAADSHLVRQIPFESVFPNEHKIEIVAVKLSRTSPDTVWVACRHGLVGSIDWTTGKGGKTFYARLGNILTADIASATFRKVEQEFLVVSELSAAGRAEIVLYGTGQGQQAGHNLAFTPKTTTHPISILRCSPSGSIIVGAAGQSIIILVADPSKTPKGLPEVQYRSYVFDTHDIPTALDFRIATQAKSYSKSTDHEIPMVDLIVGGARGSISRYDDIVTKLESLSDPSLKKQRPHASIHHWHRMAVHDLKWSLDGRYMFSGGSERVLVLWQIDTSKREYLPHLAGSVENIVVSSSGSFLVLHLDDNSTMILSTAEMKPTAYISGIQSYVSKRISKDALVQRVWTNVSKKIAPVPAAVNPSRPQWLHLCVGAGLQASTIGDAPSAPMVQTFDLDTFTSVSKQALARTQATDNSISSDGFPISEPRVTHLAFSHDGQWMATIDQWKQPTRDIDSSSTPEDFKKQLDQDRVEIYLKFWQVKDDGSFALVTRVNSPHITSSPEQVFDLVNDPHSTRFATIGKDGLVRVWRSKIRSQDGVVAKGKSGSGPLRTWSGHFATSLRSTSESEVLSLDWSSKEGFSGSLAFSEDGSTLFAAFGNKEDGRIYVLDALSGVLRMTFDDMWTGSILYLRVLSPYIITLSTSQLRLHDVVADELRYGMELPRIPSHVAEFSQLVVDRQSDTFAVVAPGKQSTTLAVFGVDEPYPLAQRTWEGRVLSLASTMGSSGYIVLDDEAQLTTITEPADPMAVTLARPLVDMNLDLVTEAAGETSEALVLLNANEEDAASDVDEAEMKEIDMDSDDDGVGGTVVNQHKLSEIFETGPAFAMPSLEDMFFQVLSLIP